MTKTVSVMKVKKSREDKIFYAVSYTFVILLTVIVLYPLILILSCSFSCSRARVDDV